MNVSFSDKKLEQCSEDGRYCIKYLGSKRAKIFMTRITNLKNAESLEDVSAGQISRTCRYTKRAMGMRFRSTIPSNF